ITLEEVNGRAAQWTVEANRVIAITAPDRPGVVLPTAARIAAVITGAMSDPSTAYVDTVNAKPLLASLPTPGKIAKPAAKDQYGVTEWELSNRAKVVLLPTTFRQDEILFRATSPGGLSVARDRDRFGELPRRRQ